MYGLSSLLPWLNRIDLEIYFEWSSGAWRVEAAENADMRVYGRYFTPRRARLGDK